MFVIIVIVNDSASYGSCSAEGLVFKANTDDCALLSGPLEGVLKYRKPELKGD